ncbi:hypothetical protein F5Y00DRAFT_271012 [Daldinia vernicosa]|uniref:uncharacterized protein n=1 Tax=Daldinia vernicosa TaxID=114800 RepID=UPI002008A54F|nr:uncharacterized protein F5Y00DRAFT_271012 [Daldinia vernicosa]KAI0847675.1 hypothetical protein F5Y00DRAFT_271012 [Daldinia vernicosa]
MAVKKRVPLPDHPPCRRRSMSATGPQPTRKEQAKQLPQKRKRGRSKAITSCERCRQAHIKCVSQGLGEPCVNCAKRSTRACSFMQRLSETDLNPPADQKEHPLQLPLDHKLQVLATSALAYMERQLLHLSVDATTSLPPA